MANKNQIPVLEKSIKVLEILAEKAPLPAKVIGMELKIPPATCYRILATLSAARWVRRDRFGNYHLSHAIGLVGALSRRMGVVLPHLAEPLKNLAQDTNLSSKVTVREGCEWLVIARHELPKDITIRQRVGMRSPVYVGSVGATLLTRETDQELKRILENTDKETSRSALRRIRNCRQHRYAVDLGETHPYIHAISAELDLGFPDSPAAMTVFGLPDELPECAVPKVARKLRATARVVQETLASNPIPA